MKLIWANFEPAINRQSLDKSAPFSSADTYEFEGFWVRSLLFLMIEVLKVLQNR